MNRTSESEQMRDLTARERERPRIPVMRSGGKPVCPDRLEDPLISKAVLEFCSIWTPGSILLYVEAENDSREQFVQTMLTELGVTITTQGVLPDLVVYDKDRSMLFLIESATNHGPISKLRRNEFEIMFKKCRANIAFITVFMNRKAMAKHLDNIAWETTAWAADSPTHLMHFDGEKLLGPYTK